MGHDTAWRVLEGCEEGDDRNTCRAGFDDVISIRDGELNAACGQFGDHELRSTGAAGDDFDGEVLTLKQAECLCGEESAVFDFGVPVEGQFGGGCCGGSGGGISSGV